jgi:mono/diheme cytochrome c family protein
MPSHVRSWGIVLIMIASVAGTARVDGAEEDLTARAMGVLRTNCITCHSGDKRKGGLSLASRAGALAGGEDGKVLVPGDPGKSALAAAL